MWRHMDMPCGDRYVFTRVYARVCGRVRAHVIREIMHLFQDNANSLIMHTL